MDYWQAGKREQASWLIQPENDEMPDFRPRERLRVLILGEDEAYSQLHGILATNIERWGYEAILLPGPEVNNASIWREVEGDILLYDMDVSRKPTVGLDEMGSGIASSHVFAQGSLRAIWPQVRLTIVLSSRSVSRVSLEQMEAIALLHKPFDMRNLERYLRVFQRLLYAEVGPGERMMARSGRAGMAEGVASLANGGRARILVADDRREVTRAVRQCLMEQEDQRYHYEVREAHDGLELLEQCLIWQPHCVVTDLLMPWLNGYQVMRCLADNAIRPLPVFVVISALMQHEIPVSRSYLQDQVVLYVDKPFDVENLLAVIERALAQ